MVVGIERERLEAIEFLHVGSQKCTCCKRKFKETDMWHCERYGRRRPVVSYWYCQECMPSAEDVLNEIDTDDIPFGLAGIDGYGTSFKKNFERLNAGVTVPKD